MVKDTCADSQHGYWLSLHLKSRAKATTPIRYNKNFASQTFDGPFNMQMLF
jgi:hypothetical protein